MGRPTLVNPPWGRSVGCLRGHLCTIFRAPTCPGACSEHSVILAWWWVGTVCGQATHSHLGGALCRSRMLSSASSIPICCSCTACTDHLSCIPPQGSTQHQRQRQRKRPWHALDSLSKGKEVCLSTADGCSNQPLSLRPLHDGQWQPVGSAQDPLHHHHGQGSCSRLARYYCAVS
jgi:hypothetical protein